MRLASTEDLAVSSDRETRPHSARSSLREFWPLPKRDALLLPIVSLMTIVALFAAAEISSRVLWPAQDEDSCVIRDAIGGYREKPNCQTRTKIAEGPWVTYRYNECGYRSNASCGPKPARTLRIVLLGSSISQGMNVPDDQTFAQLTAVTLTRRMQRPVEVQNLGVENNSVLFCYRRLQEALALKPDLVVYAITPFDLERKIDRDELVQSKEPLRTAPKAATQYRASWTQQVRSNLESSRAVLMAQHYFFRNPHTFVNVYLRFGDKADYLRTPLSLAWQRRFENLRIILTDMSSQLQRAGVPFIVVSVPSLPEAALMADPDPPRHANPFLFSDTIGGIARSAGVAYVDVVREFSRIPHCERLFYTMDQHLTSEGQAVVAQALIAKCLDGSISALRSEDIPFGDLSRIHHSSATTLATAAHVVN